MTGGDSTGPEGRSGGRSEARSAERRPERSPEGPAVCPRAIFQFYDHRENKVKILSKKVRDAQPNPRYSAKKKTSLYSDIAVYTKVIHIT